MASIRKKLSLGMGKKSKQQQQQQRHTHGGGGEEQVFYDADAAAGVAGCPGCAALQRRNAELEAELASLRRVSPKPPDSVTCFR